jgi:hypothetical protein
MGTTGMLPGVGIELREGYAEVGDVNVHYVEAGEGWSPGIRVATTVAASASRAVR